MSNLFNRIKNIIKNIDFKSKKTMLFVGLFLFTIASSAILISYGAYINSGSKNLVFGGTATLVQNGDVVLKIYEEDYYGGGGYIRRYEMPTANYLSYNASLSYCTSGLTLGSFDTTNRTFDITATKRGYCKVYFDVNPSLAPNANFRLYVEQTEGTGDYQAMALLPTVVPEDKEYTINDELTTCTDENAEITIDDGKIVVITSKNLDCDIYADLSDIIVFTSQDFTYKGTVDDPFIVPANGRYKLEVWGAQGGTYSSKAGGMGGYSYGTVSLKKNDILYIYVGGQGTTSTGGFNGGGKSYNTSAAGGGGATDIRINTDSLYARVIVAGGGGGPGNDSCATATTGYGGGETGGGLANQGSCGTQAGGGTQTEGGVGGLYSSTRGSSGSFGIGGSSTSGSWIGGGGGGGWYGGGAGATAGWSNAGAGGSGYVYTSATAANYPSGRVIDPYYQMTDAATVAGNSSTIPKPDGSGNETGHSGNGYARITYVGK